MNFQKWELFSGSPSRTREQSVAFLIEWYIGLMFEEAKRIHLKKGTEMSNGPLSCDVERGL